MTFKEYVDTLAEFGPAKALIAFADDDAPWQRLIADFRNAREQGATTMEGMEALLHSGAMMV